MPKGTGRILVVVLGALILLWGARVNLPSLRPPAEAATSTPIPSIQQAPPPASMQGTPLKDVLEADPARLLQRIRALEQKLAQVEKKVADDEARFLAHTHDFVKTTYDFQFVPFRDFLSQPDRIHPEMKVALVQHVTRPQSEKTSPPKF
jgi:hypothetical protein